jgi:hypothetical protein
MARDVFSLIHFPMMCGVIAYAASIEETVAHLDEPISFVGRVALAVGLALFVGGMAVAIWRATRRILRPRLILTAVTAIMIVAVAGVSALFTLGIAFVGIVLIVTVEQWRGRPIAE